MINLNMNLYAVARNSPNFSLDNCKFLTISRTEKMCREYVYRLAKLENLDHFNMWCNLHNYEASDELFNKYLIDTERLLDFKIIKIKYSLNDICSLLRILMECQPIGCSYESVIEQQDFLNCLNEEIKDTDINSSKLELDKQ